MCQLNCVGEIQLVKNDSRIQRKRLGTIINSQNTIAKQCDNWFLKCTDYEHLDGVTRKDQQRKNKTCTVKD